MALTFTGLGPIQGGSPPGVFPGAAQPRFPLYAWPPNPGVWVGKMYPITPLPGTNGATSTPI